jgi:hypothetical protein
MSEVDRLSNSGLYPALPIADRQRREGSGAQPGPDRRGGQPPAGSGSSKETVGSAPPRDPRSHIDEYA